MRTKTEQKMERPAWKKVMPYGLTARILAVVLAAGGLAPVPHALAADQTPELNPEQQLLDGLEPGGENGGTGAAQGGDVTPLPTDTAVPTTAPTAAPAPAQSTQPTNAPEAVPETPQQPAAFRLTSWAGAPAGEKLLWSRSISVAYGTSKSDIGLPSRLKANASDGSVVRVPVAWRTSPDREYNPNSPGTYVFTAYARSGGADAPDYTQLVAGLPKVQRVVTVLAQDAEPPVQSIEPEDAGQPANEEHEQQPAGEQQQPSKEQLPSSDGQQPSPDAGQLPAKEEQQPTPEPIVMIPVTPGEEAQQAPGLDFGASRSMSRLPGWTRTFDLENEEDTEAQPVQLLGLARFAAAAEGAGLEENLLDDEAGDDGEEDEAAIRVVTKVTLPAEQASLSVPAGTPLDELGLPGELDVTLAPVEEDGEPETAQVKVTWSASPAYNHQEYLDYQEALRLEAELAAEAARLAELEAEYNAAKEQNDKLTEEAGAGAIDPSAQAIAWNPGGETVQGGQLQPVVGAAQTGNQEAGEGDGEDAGTGTPTPPPTEYVFSANLPEGYVLADGVELPTITLTTYEVMRARANFAAFGGDINTLSIGANIHQNGVAYYVTAEDPTTMTGTVEVLELGTGGAIVATPKIVDNGYTYTVSDPNGVFKSQNAITSVSFSGYGAIPAGMFEGNSGISSVNLAGVNSIGARAFANTGLTRLTLPATLGAIGTDAFTGTGIGTINGEMRNLANAKGGFGSALNTATVICDADLAWLYKNLGFASVTAKPFATRITSTQGVVHDDQPFTVVIDLGCAPGAGSGTAITQAIFSLTGGTVSNFSYAPYVNDPNNLSNPAPSTIVTLKVTRDWIHNLSFTVPAGAYSFFNTFNTAAVFTAAPKVTGIEADPTRLKWEGGDVDITVTGTGFTPGWLPYLTMNYEGHYNLTYVSSTELTATITLPKNRNSGTTKTYTFRVEYENAGVGKYVKVRVGPGKGESDSTGTNSDTVTVPYQYEQMFQFDGIGAQVYARTVESKDMDQSGVVYYGLPRRTGTQSFAISARELDRMRQSDTTGNGYLQVTAGDYRVRVPWAALMQPVEGQEDRAKPTLTTLADLDEYLKANNISRDQLWLRVTLTPQADGTQTFALSLERQLAGSTQSRTMPATTPLGMETPLLYYPLEVGAAAGNDWVPLDSGEAVDWNNEK